MLETYIATTGYLPYVRFNEDNEIRFGQDSCFWKCIPDNINFYPIEETQNGLIVFIGDGHGILKSHREKYNIHGSYGNGAIYVFKDDILDIVDWCKKNFLK